MKRRILSVLCCGAILLALCACSDSTKESKSTDNNNGGIVSSAEEVQTSQPASDDIEVGENAVPLDGGTYDVPTYDIYIDIPNYHIMENGDTEIFSDQDNIVIVFNSPWSEEGKVTSLEEAQKIIYDNYVLLMENYSKITGLTIEKDEYLTVNGIDMYKFEGKFNCTGEIGDYDLYTIGYTFIMDDIPCCVHGTVYNREHSEDRLKPQPEEMINTTRDTVNAMIKTLRSSL